MWHVTGIGARTGVDYIYQVDAPADAVESHVINSAIQTHGLLIQTGMVDETLHPDMTTAQPL